MPTTEKKLRVLIVDDHRDAADSLGLIAEALGSQVHVTYSGMQALDVATVFRADLMLVDLAMPDLDGCSLAKQFRQIPDLAHTRIVAITGHADQGHKTLAMKAGFDAVLFKPVARNEIETVLAGVMVKTTDRMPGCLEPENSEAKQCLPIGEARRIRNQRKSKALTQAESEATICEGVIRCQAEYMGWTSERILVHFIGDLLVVRILGALTLAERRLGKVLTPANGRDLVKQVRKQLLELARPMLESLVYEVAGVKVVSMHHDISTVTGEEVILFSLGDTPHFGSRRSHGQRSKDQII